MLLPLRSVLKPVGSLLLVVLVLALAPGQLAASDHESEPVVIQLKWKHHWQFAGYYMALERGYFAEEGLAVELREATDDRRWAEEILSGRASYLVGDTAILIEHLKGQPVVLVAQIFQISPLAIFGRRDHGILVAKDLRGKRLMFSGNPAQNAALVAMLRKTLGGMEAVDVVPHSYRVDELVAGEVDAISGYLTDLAYKLRQTGLEFSVIDPATYGIDLYGDGLYTTAMEAEEHPRRVHSIRRAVLRGWQAALDDPEAAIDLIKTRYAPHLDRDHLLFEARMTRRIIMPELVPLGHHSPSRFRRIAELYVDLDLAPHARIDPGFFTVAETAAEHQQRGVSASDRAWLAEHAPLRVALPADWAPLAFTQDGRGQGLAMDLLDTIGGHLDIAFETVVVADWPQALAALRARDVDLIPTMAPTAERRDRITFTEPYASLPVMVYTREGDGYIADLSAIGDDPVGVMDQSAIAEFLAYDHPHLALRPFTGIDAGFDALEEGSIDYFLTALPIGNSALARRGDAQITVGGATPYHFDLAVGVRGDWPRLRGILERALVDIPSEELTTLRDTWMAYRPPAPPLDLSFLWWIAVPVGATLAVMLVNNLRQAASLRSVNSDLTAQVDLRERLQQERDQLNRFLEGLLEALPSALVAIDREGRIRFVNSAAQARAEEDVLAIDAPVVDAISGHPDLGEALRTALHERSPWEGRQRLVGNRHERLSVYPLANQGALIRIDDLSEAVQMESELSQARKMEGVGQLAGGIAHDFNNILQVIDCSSELLSMAHSGDDHSAGLITRIRNASQRAAALARGLLDVSRPEHRGRDQHGVAIDALIIEICELCSHTFPKNIAVSHDCDAGDAMVSIASSEMHGALLNLAVNARDAMPDGGSLHVASQRQGDQVVITFSDTGHGMDAETQQRIFDPFFSTKGAHGTGLGLAGSKRIITTRGGSIDVASEAGQGCTFTLRLPVDEVDEPTPVVPLPTDRSVDLSGIHILVVDDEDMIRDSVAIMAGRRGARCTTCPSGEAALEHMHAHPDEVDVVIMDMVMPGMHGADSLQAIRRIRPDLRAIIISGHVPQHIEEAIPVAMVCARYDKPFDPRDLLGAIAKACGRQPTS